MKIPAAALVFAGWLLVSPATALQDRPGGKMPVPDEAAQKEAEKQIREIFKSEYARTGTEDRKDLARQLFRQAAQILDDPASRYVLLRESRDLSSQAGDLDAALQAVDEMDRIFAIDAVSVKGDLLIQAAKSAQSIDVAYRIAEALLLLADDAVSRGEFETAEKVAAAAVSASRKSQDAPQGARAEARAKLIAELKGRFADIKKSIRTLRDNPGDPAANLEVGQYLCFGKGDWRTGLLHLKKGSDETFQSVAEADLAAPVDALQQVAVGDAWWDLAAKQSGFLKASILGRVDFWYAQALSKLLGATKTKIRKRLDEIREIEDAKRTWVDVTDPKLFALQGKPGQPIVISASKDPRIRYTDRYLEKKPEGVFDGFSARVRLGRNEGVEEVVGAILWKDTAGDWIWAHLSERQEFAAGSTWETNRHNVGPEKCEKRDSHVITAQISRGYVVVCLDDQEIGRIKTNGQAFERFGLRAQGTVSFDRIRLRRKE